MAITSDRFKSFGNPPRDYATIFGCEGPSARTRYRIIASTFSSLTLFEWMGVVYVCVFCRFSWHRPHQGDSHMSKPTLPMHTVVNIRWPCWSFRTFNLVLSIHANDLEKHDSLSSSFVDCCCQIVLYSIQFGSVHVLFDLPTHTHTITVHFTRSKRREKIPIQRKQN